MTTFLLVQLHIVVHPHVLLEVTFLCETHLTAMDMTLERFLVQVNAQMSVQFAHTVEHLHAALGLVSCDQCFLTLEKVFGYVLDLASLNHLVDGIEIP